MIEEILKRIEENKQFGDANIKVVPKDWGREIWVVNHDGYCGKFLEIKKGWCSSLHNHGTKDETFLLYRGLLGMEHPRNYWFMEPGNVQRIKPGETHRFTALKHSIIIEFSTHHDDADTIRQESGRSIDVSGLLKKYRAFKSSKNY